MMILPDMFASRRVFSHDTPKRLDHKTSPFYSYSALSKRHIIDVNIVINGEIRTNSINTTYSFI